MDYEARYLRGSSPTNLTMILGEGGVSGFRIIHDIINTAPPPPLWSFNIPLIQMILLFILHVIHMQIRENGYYGGRSNRSRIYLMIKYYSI